MTRTARAVRPAAESPGVAMPAPVRVKIAEINFAPYNPRVMPDAVMKSLKASLLKHGLVLNLVVQKKGNVLIGGHQRVRALRELCTEKGWAVPEEAWATVLDVSDKVARQLNVSLNRISGDFDPFKLGEMFSGILPEMTTDDVLAIGFSQDELSELVRLSGPPEELAANLESSLDALGGFGRSITLTIDGVEARDAAKEKLSTLAKARGVKPGVILIAALKTITSP